MLGLSVNSCTKTEETKLSNYSQTNWTYKFWPLR